MFTYLGASTEMDPKAITPELFADTAIAVADGFLFGIANGFSIEKSGQLVSACGYGVCQVWVPRFLRRPGKELKRSFPPESIHKNW